MAEQPCIVQVGQLLSPSPLRHQLSLVVFKSLCREMKKSIKNMSEDSRSPEGVFLPAAKAVWRTPRLDTVDIGETRGAAAGNADPFVS